MDLEIRCVIHYLYLRGRTPSNAHAELVVAYGHGCISLSGVRYWFKEFGSGRLDINDLTRSGRPLENDRIEDIKKLLDEFPFSSARYIAITLDMNKGKVLRILKHELGLTKRYARWVPHFLSDEQKEKRIVYSKSLLKLLQSLQGNQRAAVVTGDESWIYLNYPQLAMWCEGDERPP